jgi:hypothetical protein
MIPIIDSIMGIVNKFIPDANARIEAAKEIQSEMTKQMKMQSDIIKAEQSSGSYLTRNWRPLTMVLFVGMVVLDYIMYNVVPYLVVTLDLDIWIPSYPGLPPMLWELIKMGIGGYVGARTAEKIAKIIKG